MFWTSVIFYLIYSIVVLNKAYHINSKIHLICWVIPVVVTLLPLTNSTYVGSGWCYIVTDSHTPAWVKSFWYWIGFSGWVWLSLLFNFIIFIRITYYKHTLMTETRTIVDEIMNKLIVYPLIILFCWGIVTIQDTIRSLNPQIVEYTHYDLVYKIIGIGLPVSQGLLTTILYWLTMKSARKQIVTFKNSFHSIISTKSRIFMEEISTTGNSNSKSRMVQLSQLSHNNNIINNTNRINCPSLSPTEDKLFKVRIEINNNVNLITAPFQEDKDFIEIEENNRPNHNYIKHKHVKEDIVIENIIDFF